MTIARRVPLVAGLALCAAIGCRHKDEHHSVTLTWTPPARVSIASYNIYRATPDTNLVKVADNVPAPPYEDKFVTTGQTYRYAVTAIDQQGHESKFSATVQAKIP